MRVVIADDEALLRQGLARLLEDAGVDVASTVAEPAGLLRAVASYDPDVAIVDIRMPPSHTDEGLAAAGEIRRTHPRTGVLVLSHHLESAYAARLLEGRPSGRATCSRTGLPTSPSCSTRCAASPRASA